MKQPDLLDRYITALRQNPTNPPPPGLDPMVARAIQAMLMDDPPEIPPVGARERVWRQVLTNAQTAQPHRDASRDPRPGSWMIHSNGRTKENDPMQTILTRPTILPRAPTHTLHTRLFRLAAAVFAVLLSAAILLPGLLQDTSPSGPAVIYLPSAANKAIFERYINEAWNTGNTDALNDILIADHVCHEPGMTDIEGIDGMTAMIANYRAAFPDWQFTIESITATDDEVWVRLTGTGTHNGPFALPDDVVIETTGNAVMVEVMLNAHFVDGKITEQWMQSDALGMLLQTETIPTPQQAIADTQQAATEAQNLEVARRAAEDMSDMETPYDASEYYDQWAFHILEPGDSVNLIASYRSDWINNELRRSFPDLQITIERITPSGNLVIIEATARGQFEEDFYWRDDRIVPPTGQVETWSWVYVYRFEDGKIVSEQWYWDWPTLYED